MNRSMMCRTIVRRTRGFLVAGLAAWATLSVVGCAGDTTVASDESVETPTMSQEEMAIAMQPKPATDPSHATPKTPVEPTVVIDGSDTPWLGYWQGEAARAEKEVVPVAGQTFKEAVRVEVHEPVDPAWDVQVLSPNSTATVDAGDKLRVTFWARAEPVDGQKPEVTAILQTDAGAEYLLVMEPTLTDAWRQFEGDVTSEAAHGLDELAVVFHLGHVRQTVEIADPRMVTVAAE
ncbi:MAG: hypothetical protein AAF333_00035 [Planctomycetota bacterium]